MKSSRSLRIVKSLHLLPPLSFLTVRSIIKPQRIARHQRLKPATIASSPTNTSNKPQATALRPNRITVVLKSSPPSLKPPHQENLNTIPSTLPRISRPNKPLCPLVSSNARRAVPLITKVAHNKWTERNEKRRNHRPPVAHHHLPNS